MLEGPLFDAIALQCGWVLRVLGRAGREFDDMVVVLVVVSALGWVPDASMINTPLPSLKST
jgi:hypothetical protein